MNEKTRKLWLTPEIGVLFLALTLRVVLAYFNREFNDDHVEVISLIADNGLFPPKNACYECYHPQLYHTFCALWVKLFSITDLEQRRVLAQYINVAAGMLTLGLVKNFLKQIAAPRIAAFWALALIALNPDFIGINAQASNDTFVIFFGTLSFYCGWMTFRNFRTSWIFATAFAVVCAALSKASGLAIFLAIFGGWTIAWLTGTFDRKKIARALVILTVLFFGTVPFLGGYVEHYRQYGNPFVMNDPKDPPPHWFEETYVNRPGVTSIASGYFTFRIFSLLETPYVTQGFTDYPAHRTSLWSQLYGRLNFVHFGQFPKGWASTDPWIINLGRMLLTLALLPLFFFLKGIGVQLRRLFRMVQRREWIQREFSETAFNLLGLAGIAAISIKVSYDIRCFCGMKGIYVLPALLCWAKCFVDGYGAELSVPKNRIIHWTLATLCLLYCVDIGALILSLA